MLSVSALLVSNIGVKVYGSFCGAGQSEESIGQVQIISVNHGRAVNGTAISLFPHMGRESKPGGCAFSSSHTCGACGTTGASCPHFHDISLVGQLG